MCRVLGVSTSGYYAWRTRPRSERARADAELSLHIQAIHERSSATYGAPRIHAELTAQGVRVGRKRVARLMEVAGIYGVSRRKWITTTTRDRAARPAPDLVERNFSATAPNELWVADITYVPTWTGFLYLAVVLDTFSRRVVGWAMETHLRTELVLAALNMALGQRRPAAVIHHSDHGTQYTSIAFGMRCREAGVRPSMGSIGDCFDNAMCESFFATLECELLDRRRFRTQVEARMAIFDFIEGWYNPHRRHSALGYYSPIDYERVHKGDANQTLRCAAAARTAWPPKDVASGALHRVASADPKPSSFPASPSEQMKGAAEKLKSDQC
jgi:putative transposase